VLIVSGITNRFRAITRVPPELGVRRLLWTVILPFLNFQKFPP
jgi:hypothetical protein